MNIKLIPSEPVVQLQMSMEKAEMLKEILKCIDGGIGCSLSFSCTPNVKSMASAREFLEDTHDKLEEVLDI